MKLTGAFEGELCSDVIPRVGEFIMTPNGMLVVNCIIYSLKPFGEGCIEISETQIVLNHLTES